MVVKAIRFILHFMAKILVGTDFLIVFYCSYAQTQNVQVYNKISFCWSYNMAVYVYC